MTRVVRPSADTKMAASPFAAAIRHAGGREAWIVEAGRDVATDTITELTTGAKNGFAHVSSSGLTFTIDTGEAFIGGRYVAADETTSFTVPDEATTTLYLGYSRGGPDQFRFGTPTEIGTAEPMMEAFEVTASGGTITSHSDLRETGEPGALGGGGLQGDIPLTRVFDGQRARNIEYIGPPDEVRLTRAVLMGEDGMYPTDCTFEIRDMSTNSVLYSMEARIRSGDVDDPIKTIGGGRPIEFAVRNRSGSAKIIGAKYEYVITGSE